MQFSVAYKLGFAVAVCAVCALVASTVAVSLRPRQEANRRILGQGRQILAVAGLIEAGEVLSGEDIAERLFGALEARLVDLRSGEFVEGVDAVAYDQRKATDDPSTSDAVEDNPAGVQRVPRRARIFVRRGADGADTYVLPIEGKGMWGDMRGFLAMAGDGRTIRGITFYEHSETPGYGAEVENPEWQKSWRGRRAYDDEGVPRIAVSKGEAGPPADDPYQVDGISGSTMTSDAVTHLVRFWLGDRGYGPFLRSRQAEEAR